MNNTMKNLKAFGEVLNLVGRLGGSPAYNYYEGLTRHYPLSRAWKIPCKPFGSMAQTIQNICDYLNNRGVDCKTTFGTCVDFYIISSYKAEGWTIDYKAFTIYIDKCSDFITLTYLETCPI